jgi:hypothetical protein
VPWSRSGGRFRRTDQHTLKSRYKSTSNNLFLINVKIINAPPFPRRLVAQFTRSPVPTASRFNRKLGNRPKTSKTARVGTPDLPPLCQNFLHQHPVFQSHHHPPPHRCRHRHPRNRRPARRPPSIHGIRRDRHHHHGCLHHIPLPSLLEPPRTDNYSKFIRLLRTKGITPFINQPS